MNQDILTHPEDYILIVGMLVAAAAVFLTIKSWRDAK